MKRHQKTVYFTFGATEQIIHDCFQVMLEQLVKL